MLNGICWALAVGLGACLSDYLTHCIIPIFDQFTIKHRKIISVTLFSKEATLQHQVKLNEI